MNRTHGFLAGIAAYSLWGFLPLYWKLLRSVPAFEILCHRMFWSVFAVGILLKFFPGKNEVREIVSSKKQLFVLFCSALLIGANWFTYIWAVNADMLLEASMGYFINPLVTVFFGMLFFKERLRPYQIFAIFLALMGVLNFAFHLGSLPIIGLTLSGTFATYTVLRRLSRAGSIDGLFLETSLLCLPALGLIGTLEGGGSGHFLNSPLSTQTLLVGAGPATAIPLLFFAYAARNLPFSSLGFLQYSAPTIQFFLALFVFHEPLSRAKLVSFCFIWTALFVYTTGGYCRQRTTSVAS